MSLRYGLHPPVGFVLSAGTFLGAAILPGLAHSCYVADVRDGAMVPTLSLTAAKVFPTRQEADDVAKALEATHPAIGVSSMDIRPYDYSRGWN